MEIEFTIIQLISHQKISKVSFFIFLCTFMYICISLHIFKLKRRVAHLVQVQALICRCLSVQALPSLLTLARATKADAFIYPLAVKSELGYWLRSSPKKCSMWHSLSACLRDHGSHDSCLEAAMLTAVRATPCNALRVCGANCILPRPALQRVSFCDATKAQRSSKMNPESASSVRTARGRLPLSIGASCSQM